MVRGDIYLVELKSKGSIQGGIRPVIVVSNNRANTYSPVVQVIPITSSKTKKHLPTHVQIGLESGLKIESTALAEQLTIIDKDDLITQVGMVDAKVMREVDRALSIQIGVFDYIKAGMMANRKQTNNIREVEFV
jgi:mRNA interferase MazF